MPNQQGQRGPDNSNGNNEDSSGVMRILRETERVIQGITHFIGVGTNRERNEAEIEDQSKWDKKRLRLISKKYSLNTNEVHKFVRNISVGHDHNAGSSSILYTTEDLERGTTRVFAPQTSGSRVPLGSATLQSHEQSNQSLDQSRLSKTRINTVDTRESIPAALLSSLGSFIKKGTLIDQSRIKKQTAFSSRNSFDIDMISEASPPCTPITPEDETSPSGIVFDTPNTLSRKRNLITSSSAKHRGDSHMEAHADSIISEIPEETSFEVEIAERGDIDETEEGVFDETAEDRMKQKVRKKSSVHRTLPDRPSSMVLRDAKGHSLKPDRPSDLSIGTKPLYKESASAPVILSGSSRKIKKPVDVLEHLAEISEQTDVNDAESSQISAVRFRGRRVPPHIPVNRTISLVDEVFFDDNLEPPAISTYHQDIAPSPPTSAQLKNTVTYSFDPPVRYRQEAGITYIDIGDSSITHPKKTSLGPKIDPFASSSKTDRPRTESSSRNPLIRQSTVDDVNISPDMKTQRKNEFLNAISREYKKHALRSHKKRQRGMGIFAKTLGRKLNIETLNKEVRELIEEGVDQRTWVTLWATTIQIFVCLFSIFLYGIGPFGLGLAELNDEVLDTSLTFRRVSYKEPRNLWLGPRYADLILLGAKYTPCMRYEPELWAEIENDKKLENRTGCCIANDRSGCYQSSELICPLKVARWVRWDKVKTRKVPPMLERKSKSESDLFKGITPPVIGGPAARMSGAVCGQDPDYCEFPVSTGNDIWPDDITKWPICERRHEGFRMPDHMTCRITGRPCCIQLQGLCRISTREYCDFVNGQWHENATLCSQVNCFDGVCGMVPFFSQYPDQISRLFISLFVHAGIIHLIVTLLFQFYIMRDMEQLIGPTRMAILYFVSGIGGNLASAIFVPYNPDVGPSGAQFGVLASYIVDIWHHRKIIENVRTAVFQNLLLMGILLICGVFPYVDSWAHLVGFFLGLLTTIVIFPYIDFEADNDKIPNGPILQEVATPNSAIGSPMNTVVMMADTPLSMDGYSQLANGFTDQNSIPPTFISSIFYSFQKFSNFSVTKRTYWVIIAVIIEVGIFLSLILAFLRVWDFKCSWCIYINCLPYSGLCENQGQTLNKWLPI